MKFDLINRNGACIASGDAHLNTDGVWRGIVLKNDMPKALLTLFRDLEQAVNDQTFRHAERIGDLISRWNLYMHLGDGRTMLALDIFLNEQSGVSWKDNNKRE